MKKIIKGKGKLVVFIASVLFLGALSAGAASKITSIDFKNGADSSTIEIHSDQPVTFEKQENSADKQIILDLKDATLASGASRPLDTSSFDSKVTLISPYASPDQPSDSRVVIQLKDMASANVTQNGNVLSISVPSGTSSPTPSSSPSAASAAAGADAALAAAAANPSIAENLPPPPVSKSPAENSSAEVATEAAANPVPTPAPTSQDKLQSFMDSQETQRFTGRPITLQVRDADLVDVFRLIADASGFNIIVGDDVKGKITLAMTDVPWDQALDVILHTQKLGAERNNNILRIVTLTNLTAEKQQELAAKQAADATTPRVTRIFPVSYANLGDLSGLLTKFATTTAAGAATTTSGTAPFVQADNRTNSIIIRDTVASIDRMKKLIDILDTQTPQVLIEAKVVEASEQFAKAISGGLGFGSPTASSQFFGSFNGADPVSNLFSLNGSPGIFTVPAGSSIQSAGGGQFGLSPAFAFLPGNIRLNALLSLSETENNVRVVSSPKAVVLNKETATITQGTPILIPTTVVTAAGAQPGSSVVSANISLNVVPTVTNEGSILMQLNVSRDTPLSLSATGGTSGQVAVGSRNITTKVLVESGSTLVMGGIYSMQNSTSTGGVPFLRSIPIIGVLFSSDTDQTQRSELFFFITPRILNPKEAGLPTL